MNITELKKTLSGRVWSRIRAVPRAGLLAPLFSVKSSQSIGVGDFFDLYLLLRLCRESGCSFLQILPMNESSAENCPYDAPSAFGFDPVWFSPEMLPSRTKKRYEGRIRDMRERFSSKKRPDYSAREVKRAFLWELFQEQSSSLYTMRSFERENKWLQDYALYKVLKKRYDGAPWRQWPLLLQEREPGALEKAAEECKEEILFEKWMQWVLFYQFSSLRRRASEGRVLLFGDLPVLAAEDSVDVWRGQHLFHLDRAAGAPPDMYCASGQRWGMPPYRWSALRKEEFLTLKEKVRYAGRLYDMVRIDHVVGFFRIWAIPREEPQETEGLHGFFDPSDPSCWTSQGREILKAMAEATNALLVAEDLGIVPEGCPETLVSLGIPGFDVQRWKKNWSSGSFLSPSEYRPLSVAALSTHDTTPWSSWWDYEAGTVDARIVEQVFLQSGISLECAKSLFSSSPEGVSRVQWRPEITSPEKVAAIVERNPSEIERLLTLHRESFGEKEGFLLLCGMERNPLQAADSSLATAALRFLFATKSLFAVAGLPEALFAAGLLGSVEGLRINVPGTVRSQNWRPEIPLLLEEILESSFPDFFRNLLEEEARIAE
ncbi:MAG: 4-alpha-glucanotransferase [Candidatus Ratteibacteria bacterium]|jgi:4-alpha-glucanotransferase